MLVVFRDRFEENAYFRPPECNFASLARSQTAWQAMRRECKHGRENNPSGVENPIRRIAKTESKCRFRKQSRSSGSRRAGYIDGGAASGALPQFLLGVGPILSTNVAPFAMSFWLNHGLFHGLPFNVAD